MQNYYAVLGVSHDTSFSDIKKAYRRLALAYHPDKTGGDDAKIKLINEAYDILSDSEKRQQYDETWSLLGEEDEENVPGNYDCLPTGGVPYSQEFRQKHAMWVTTFCRKPLATGHAREYFSVFASDVYKPSSANTIFEYIVEQEKSDNVSKTFKPGKQALTLETCITYFSDFLYGHYYGDSLLKLIDYFKQQTEKAKTDHLLYETVYRIMAMTQAAVIDHNELLLAMQQLTHYAKNLAPLPIIFVNLFQDRYFRALFQFAINGYWQEAQFKVNQATLDAYDGRDNTEKFLRELKEKIALRSGAGQDDPIIKDSIKSLSLLSRFERSVHKKDIEVREAHDYRETAYHILDWIPAFTGKLTPAMLVTIFMQAGLYFQLASTLESVPEVQMADEKLAQSLYVTVFAIGHHATPDVALYAYVHGLKYMASFGYQNNELADLIKAFQRAANVTMDIFPFYEKPAPAIDFLQQENKLLRTLRQFLQALVLLTDANPSRPLSLTMDHPQAVVLYRAYEACIKHWYEETYQKKTEENIRVHLMATLLTDQGWDFDEVEDNLAFTKSSLTRDELVWFKSASIWDVTDEKRNDQFCSVEGIEVNYKTGRIQLLVEPCGNETPDCFRSITSADIVEMIQKNMVAAIFSLDPVDPDMPYHPFNHMRIFPKRLHQTRLIETLLSTDYLLKFLTVGQEVRGSYPFDERPLDALTQHLPEYLQKIIDDFHQAQKQESIHRFWIEADSITTAEDISQLESERSRTIHLYDTQMVVKKHLMIRDADGNLIDADESEEGWFFYILNAKQAHAFDRGKYDIESPAMVFLSEGSLVRFVENGEISTFTLKNYDDQLRRFRRYCVTEKTGKVINNVISREMTYLLTREIEHQTGKPHKYSPEEIFAREFTLHYEEFALYFPEFKRLQELSRVMTLVRILNGVRQSNQLNIKNLQQKLRYIMARLQGVDHLDDEESVTDEMLEWRKECSAEQLLVKSRAQLRNIRGQIGTLKFSSHCPEVNEICDKMYDGAVSRYGCQYSGEILAQIGRQRSSIASRISKQKRADCREQLYNLFSSQGATTAAIDKFLNEDPEPLAQQLAKGALNEIKSLLQDHLNGCEKLETEIADMGLGLNEEEIDLLGICLWVPANVKHDVSLANNESRFVYGGVSLNARILNSNQVLSNPNARSINARQLMGGGGDSRGGNGGSSGGSGGGPGGHGRFTMLVNNGSKADVRNMLSQANHGLTQDQVTAVKKTLGTGAMDSVSVKRMNNSDVRVFAVRSGHTEGYQRMSYGFDAAGSRTGIVQTAFDNQGNLVRQRPGEAKNNLYDVKYPK